MGLSRGGRIVADQKSKGVGGAMLARACVECNVGIAARPLTRPTRMAISAAPGTSGLLALDWILAMTTGSRLSSDGLDARRKRLLFRCWHRGTKELDLIVGRFADAHLTGLSDAELGQLEQMLDVPDPELYAALIGEAPTPEGVAVSMLTRIKSFHAAGPAR